MNVSGTQGRKYPYAGEPVAENRQIYRFMDTDLMKFLKRIAERIIPHSAKAWETLKEALHEASMSDDRDDRRLIWLTYKGGSCMYAEQETFIEDTPAYKHIAQLGRDGTDVTGYIIEAKGYGNGILIGNVCEIGDFTDYAWHVKKTALPLNSVTVEYSDGRVMEAEKYVYMRDKEQIMYRQGKVAGICYHPGASMTGMTGLLSRERANRMALPVGNAEKHIEMLDRKYAETHGYRPPLKMPLQKPAEVRKPSIAERLAAAERETKNYNAKIAQRSINKNMNMKKETANNER